ncbi:hypothetical protein [Natrinema soli]|uniref:Uncharacterized protein n=1 Tax=Natrinema soli TaxID=1930624 RepID=A0ABD5SQ79_9EURY|nr:hypothetical protein [Natrinema soli]
MNQRTDRAVTVLRAIVHEIRVERITFMAGSIAYHAFVSLLPLLLVLLTAVSAVGGQQLEVALVSVTQAAFTPVPLLTVTSSGLRRFVQAMCSRAKPLLCYVQKLHTR